MTVCFMFFLFIYKKILEEEISFSLDIRSLPIAYLYIGREFTFKFEETGVFIRGFFFISRVSEFIIIVSINENIEKGNSFQGYTVT